MTESLSYEPTCRCARCGFPMFDDSGCMIILASGTVICEACFREGDR